MFPESMPFLRNIPGKSASESEKHRPSESYSNLRKEKRYKNLKKSYVMFLNACNVNITYIFTTVTK